MQKTCTFSGTSFLVPDEDLQFYEDISPVFNGKKYLIPPPTLCPQARWQRRLAWRNDRAMYSRTCDKTGQHMLSIFSADKTFPVYENDVWWSDVWDPLDYGREIDFNQPFFEQFDDLQNAVPHPAMAILKPTMENSSYCNQVGYVKNCYLIFDSRRDEQCMYGKTFERCFDCMDCYKVFDCETCYECNSCYSCTFSTYLLNSYNCAECHFSSNLNGCKNCFGCVNLNNKQFYIFNEQYGEQEYAEEVDRLRSMFSVQELFAKLFTFRATLPAKYMHERNTEDCSGDYLFECANVHDCYDCEYLQDSKYCGDIKKLDAPNARLYDFTYFGGECEECYECVNCGYTLNRGIFCDNTWTCDNILYSRYSKSCSHLFGCFGLHQKQYCILNKQYTKVEYESLAAKLVEHMMQTDEWGEFFPVHFSQYGYNESVAQEFFPLSKEKVLNNGWNWKEHEEDLAYEKVVDAQQLPTSINNVPDDILNWAIKCKQTGRLFKLIKQELDFYRRMQLPVPHLHPDERHKRRLNMKNPRELIERSCSHCDLNLYTTYSSQNREKVLCNNCHKKEVY